MERVFLYFRVLFYDFYDKIKVLFDIMFSMKITTLVWKKQLTADVFELRYTSQLDMSFCKSGQFITFIIPDIWGRAYSISNVVGDEIILLIKRVSLENGGKWWSIALCDSALWTEFNSVGPIGKFVLQENMKSKCFLWTGTGLAPLYHQVLRSIDFYNDYANKTDETAETKYYSHDQSVPNTAFGSLWTESRLHIVFWVRKYEDVFYEQELLDLKKLYKNFDFTIYLSRETHMKKDYFKPGYVTEFLDKQSVQKYWEYYLCWAPVVVDSCEKKLEELGISEHMIFEEKY